MDTLDLFSHLYPNERSQIKGDSASSEKRMQRNVYPPSLLYKSTSTTSAFSETLVAKEYSKSPITSTAAEKTITEEETGKVLRYFEMLAMLPYNYLYQQYRGSVKRIRRKYINLSSIPSSRRRWITLNEVR